jgi:hypothetical protein
MRLLSLAVVAAVPVQTAQVGLVVAVVPVVCALFQTPQSRRAQHSHLQLAVADIGESTAATTLNSLAPTALHQSSEALPLLVAVMAA